MLYLTIGIIVSVISLVAFMSLMVWELIYPSNKLTILNYLFIGALVSIMFGLLWPVMLMELIIGILVLIGYGIFLLGKKLINPYALTYSWIQAHVCLIVFLIIWPFKQYISIVAIIICGISSIILMAYFFAEKSKISNTIKS